MTPNQRANPAGSSASASIIWTAAITLILCSGSIASAQDSQSDQQRAVEEARRVLPIVNRSDRIVMPTRASVAQPVRPGLTEGEDWLRLIDEAVGATRAAGGLPEGTFVIERPGSVIAGPHERRVFVPDRDRRLPGEGPMLLMPNATLERLELAAASREMEVTVSGEVFVYQNRRYLLLSTFLPGKIEPEPQPEPVDEAPATEATESPAEDQPASLADDPEVQDLFAELEADAPSRSAAERTERTLEERANSGASGIPPAPDGTPITRRTGRLVRLGDGAWQFVFDNDSADRIASSAMTVLPCRLLERMERDALRLGDAGKLMVSGQIFTYGGDAYLLPTMLIRAQTGGLVPLQ